MAHDEKKDEKKVEAPEAPKAGEKKAADIPMTNTAASVDDEKGTAEEKVVFQGTMTKYKDGRPVLTDHLDPEETLVKNDDDENKKRESAGGLKSGDSKK